MRRTLAEDKRYQDPAALDKRIAYLKRAREREDDAATAADRATRCQDCEEEHDEGACPENRLSFDALRSAIVNAVEDIKTKGGRLSCGFLQAVPLGDLVRALHERLYCYTKEPGIFCTPCNEGDGYAKHCAGCGKVF